MLIEEAVDIADELYVGLVVDRISQKVALMASSEGGMEIEKVAAETPEKIHKSFISPTSGVNQDEFADIARKIGIPESAQSQAVDIFESLYRAFCDNDMSLIEINPLIITGDGRVIALDAKVNFDDNGLFRHPELAALRDETEEDPDEIEAAKYDLSYISLDGNIGCMVNGAGLAMATMDAIKLYGGEPANFLDVGGGASTEQVTAAFKLMLHNENLSGILVNIFGGIMRCDVIAQGVVAAAREAQLSVPLVVRLEGTNVAEGRKILSDSGIAIITADTMADAAQKAVEAAR